MVHGFGQSVAQGLFEKCIKVQLFNQAIFGISLSQRGDLGGSFSRESRRDRGNAS